MQFKRYLALLTAAITMLFAFLVPFTISTAFDAIASSYGAMMLTPSTKQTYTASTSTFIVPAASTTDVFTIYGSASKTVKILRIDMNNTCTTASASLTDKIFLIKRSSAPTGGTSTTLTAVPLDSNNAAATATNVKSFTANPTVGGTVGTIASCALYGLIATQNSLAFVNVFDHRLTGQPIVLRGTSEGVAINYAGVTPGGGTPLLSFTVTWIEE